MSKSPPTAVLLLTCPDQRGLVSTVSDFLSRHQGNIIHADQHTDQEKGLFLQRVEWELDGFTLKRAEIAPTFEVIAQKLNMKWRLHFSDARPRISLFVSKRPHCLYDILVRWRMQEYHADFPLVISNHSDHRSIATEFDTEFRHFPITPETKKEQEEKILVALKDAKIELIVLARYMQVLTADFVEKFPNRIINIHHSSLPAFAGARPYHQAHERGVKIIGATAHYVTSDLDQGPIIAQDVARISHRDSVADLIRKGRDLEKIVLARALDHHLKHSVIAYENKTVVFE